LYANECVGHSAEFQQANPPLGLDRLRRSRASNLEKGDTGSALRDLDEATRLAPNFAFAFNLRGEVLQERGDFMRAIRNFSNAIGIRPDLAEAFYNRSLARRATGNDQGARADYRAALKLGYVPEDLE
jgi:tetratricopeptide (TPR) repeat protein